VPVLLLNAPVSAQPNAQPQRRQHRLDRSATSATSDPARFTSSITGVSAFAIAGASACFYFARGMIVIPAGTRNPTVAARSAFMGDELLTTRPKRNAQPQDSNTTLPHDRSGVHRPPAEFNYARPRQLFARLFVFAWRLVERTERFGLDLVQ